MWIIAHKRFLFINPETGEQHQVQASAQQEEAPDWIKEDGLYDLARKEKTLVITEAPPAEEEDEVKDTRVKHIKAGSGLQPTWKK
jgi:hypothetical protein